MRSPSININSDLFRIDCSNIQKDKNEFDSIKIETHLSPSPRWGHIGVAYNNSLIIFGGRNENDLGDAFMFSTTSLEWTQLMDGTDKK